MRRMVLMALAAAIAGCGGSGEGVLVVGVASSMTEVARSLGDAYGPARIEISVAGSQVLVSQVREGAPLDVVLTADADTAGALSDLGVVAGDPVRFAGNRLTIAVAEGNPGGISGLADLARADVTVVLAAPEVPAGRYTMALLDRADISISPASLEPSVRAVLAKVRLGEADAGIVYVTDLEPGGAIGRVSLPDEINPVTGYYAAALQTASDPAAAAAFVEFLLSPEAVAVLRQFGFLV